VTQLQHSRNPTVSVSIKEEGMFQKKKSLVIAAAGDCNAGDVLSLDLAPGKLESKVGDCVTLACSQR
jgi:hypothetical protein